MYLYHTTKKSLRKDITKQGLIGHKLRPVWADIREADEDKNVHGVDKVQPLGNYGFETINGAISYHHTLSMNNIIALGEEVDIWRMDTTGLPVFYDPEAHIASPIEWEEFESGLEEDIGIQEQIDMCTDGVCTHCTNDRRWYTPNWVEPFRLKRLNSPQWWAARQKDGKEICEIRERVKPFPVWSH